MAETEKIMTACFLVAQGSLIRCLVQLGKTHDDDWLAEFEDQLVRDAISMVAKGAPADSDLLIKNVVEMLHFIFDSARRQIAKGAKDG
jgi:hypothetical protein